MVLEIELPGIAGRYRGASRRRQLRDPHRHRLRRGHRSLRKPLPAKHGQHLDRPGDDRRLHAASTRWATRTRWNPGATASSPAASTAWRWAGCSSASRCSPAPPTPRRSRSPAGRTSARPRLPADRLPAGHRAPGLAGRAPIPRTDFARSCAGSRYNIHPAVALAPRLEAAGPRAELGERSSTTCRSRRCSSMRRPPIRAATSPISARSQVATPSHLIDAAPMARWCDSVSPQWRLHLPPVLRPLPGLRAGARSRRPLSSPTAGSAGPWRDTPSWRR